MLETQVRVLVSACYQSNQQAAGSQGTQELDPAPHPPAPPPPSLALEEAPTASSRAS